MNKPVKLLYIIFTVLGTINLYAEVPVGIIPLKGSDQGKTAIEQKIKSILLELGGISIIADDQIQKITELHEKAQALGSDYHDISKLKIAEYIIEGSVNSGTAQVKAINVNTCAEVMNTTVKLDSSSSDYALKKLAKEIQMAILIDAAGKTRDIPEDAAPYMEILKQFVSSLSKGDRASYPYIVFYKNGKYMKPAENDKNDSEKARRFLMVIRPNLVRSTISYLFIKTAPPWVYGNVLANKLGKKTIHRFGIIELPDGAIAIGIYEKAD